MVTHGPRRSSQSNEMPEATRCPRIGGKKAKLHLNVNVNDMEEYLETYEKQKQQK